MPNLNKVMLMGNLTRDPELRTLPKGTPVCQFSLAINREFKLESGEKREEVLFVDVEAWGKGAEIVAKYCTKGKPLYVEGRLRLDTWEDKTTKEKRSRMKVVMEQFQFLGTREGAPVGSTAPVDEAPRAASAPRSATPAAKPENIDEDVPF